LASPGLPFQPAIVRRNRVVVTQGALSALATLGCEI
jgi:hypothetical protein